MPKEDSRASALEDMKHDLELALTKVVGEVTPVSLGGKVQSPGPTCPVPSFLLNNLETGCSSLSKPESLRKTAGQKLHVVITDTCRARLQRPSPASGASRARAEQDCRGPLPPAGLPDTCRARLQRPSPAGGASRGQQVVLDVVLSCRAAQTGTAAQASHAGAEYQINFR